MEIDTDLQRTINRYERMRGMPLTADYLEAERAMLDALRHHDGVVEHRGISYRWSSIDQWFARYIVTVPRFKAKISPPRCRPRKEDAA